MVASLVTIFLSAAMLALAAGGEKVSGVLETGSGGRPAVRTASGDTIYLEGDASTMKVLADKRLHGKAFEAAGERVAPDRFHVGPFHKESMWAVRDGKKLLITYWCEVCAIRAYTPGPCQCCQEDTELDLLEEAAYVHAY